MPFFLALILTFFHLRVHPLPPVERFILPVSPTPILTIPIPKTTILPDSSPWGVAQKVGEHTYSIKVQNDAVMATPGEILKAINDLRARSSAQPLTSDSRLCEYARVRAGLFNQIKKTDAHAGFIDYLDNQDGFHKLGYAQLGENSSYGYIMSGVHLVEFVYMQSSEHNQNQIDPKWDHGCAGVSGSATDILFATSPL